MESFEERYRAARRGVIAKDLRRLNPMQRDAAMTTQGPLLLLAGAGSGKTTVLIQRIYNLLTYGSGSDAEFVPEWATEDDLDFLERFPDAPSEDEFQRARRLCAVDPPRPWEILAITFTNKAAGELKERLAARLGDDAEDIWASTFHTACVRILRRYIDRLGFERDFTIYDTDDSRRALKDIIAELNLQDQEAFNVKKVLYKISRAKNSGITPEGYEKLHTLEQDWETKHIAKIYASYQRHLSASNALDFDDILLYTVELLKQEPDVLEHYQSQFHYVLVDEYQDTNRVQDVLTSLLAGGWRNLCVVGDDDQAIYGFRGASSENLLNFNKRYPDARTIRLEQNYRSTKHILDAVNAVIAKNHPQEPKKLTTENGEGEKILIQCVSDEKEEAAFVVRSISDSVQRGQRDYRDIAILYRTNAQAKPFEDALVIEGIPYQMVGDIKFFNRAEVKDMLAYLHVANNPFDNLRLSRIANKPPRGIGNITMKKATSVAESQGLSLYEVFRNADIFPELKSVKEKLLQFADLLDGLRQKGKEILLTDFYDMVCKKSGYVQALEEKSGAENEKRLGNVRELKSTISRFLERSPTDATLSGFLNETALYTDLDSIELQSNYVTLMTVHSAKGLEFPVVYLVGMEENVFPAVPYDSAGLTPEDEAEERRLCYVAMTRAKERLVLTTALQRMRYGATRPCSPSRFLREIPAEHCDWSRDFWRDTDFISEYNEGAFRNTYGSRVGHYGGYAGITERGGSGKATPATQSQSRNAKLSLKPGDLVEHTAFGKGIVLNVQTMARDALVEIRFDGPGVKKLMLNAAAGRMKKL